MAYEAIEPFVSKGRQLSSWIEGFLELTKGMQSPALFRKWAAIGSVAAALERKVWLVSQRQIIYPNLYIFLVGPPGAGKTRALAYAEGIWRSLESHHVAKVSLTKAALMDEIAASTRVIYTKEEEMHFNAAFLASHELGALIPGYDSDILNALVVLYDNELYTEKRRGNRDPVVIERPTLTLVACTTPSYLVNTMPAGAWDQGFLSRVIVIYSDEEGVLPRLNLLDEDVDANPLEKALRADIKAIGDHVGRLSFTRPAAEALEEWYAKGQKISAPIHPRLTRYCVRRPVHLMKLCMVSCIDRGATHIDLFDVQRSLDWLIEAEGVMPDLFVAMQSGGDAAVIDEAWHYILTYPARNNGENLPLFRLVQFLQGRVPAMSLQRILEVMERAELVTFKKTADGPVAIARPKN